MKKILVFIILIISLFLNSCEKIFLGPDKIPPNPVEHALQFTTILDSLRFALDFPALAAAIVTDDTILFSDAVGSRHYAGPMNVTNDDLFHLGSNTKAFTAVLMGVLVDEGLVKWTTTISTIFPEYAGAMKEEYKDVTVREILSHSAGFMRDPHLVLHPATPADQRREVVSWALKQSPACQEGTYLYSNLGYIIAGAIEEKLSGIPYEELLINRVLEPLGITSGGFGPVGTSGLEDEPLQHTNSHAIIQPTGDADNPPIYSPAGRLHMTIGDWAKFIRWVLSAEAHHQTLLDYETANILTSDIVKDGGGGFYAMGWSISQQTLSGGRTITHAGSNGFNYSVAWLAPIKRFGVIAVTNQGPGTSANPLNIVATRFIHFYLNGR